MTEQPESTCFAFLAQKIQTVSDRISPHFRANRGREELF